MEKTYYSFAGGPVNLAQVKQGDRVIVRIAGGSQQGRTVALAVDDALPAGFEIESVLGPDDADKGPFKFLGSLTTPKAQESRDDRYVAALDLRRRQDLRARLRAEGRHARRLLRPGRGDPRHATGTVTVVL